MTNAVFSALASRALTAIGLLFLIPSAASAHGIDSSLEALGPLACSGQTGAGAVLNAMQPQPGDGLAIFGVGAVGLSALMAAKISGCDPIVAVDVHAHRNALHDLHPVSAGVLCGQERELLGRSRADARDLAVPRDAWMVSTVTVTGCPGRT